MYENGRLPDTELAPIAGGRLRKDAAAAFNAMNVQARKLGVELRPTGPRSSYRSFAQQRELWSLYLAGRGNLAARPGTSNHGWGLAVDLSTPEMWNTVNRIGAAYGYQKKWSDAPTEPWHFTYRPGIYTGPDPGPDGTATPKPERKEEPVIRTIRNTDGRLEHFVRKSNGNVTHTWQVKAMGTYVGAKSGVRTAQWFSLGAPGKGKEMDVVLRKDGAIVVVIRNEDGTVKTRNQKKPNGEWSAGWTNLGNPGK